MYVTESSVFFGCLRLWCVWPSLSAKTFLLFVSAFFASNLTFSFFGNKIYVSFDKQYANKLLEISC